MPVSKFIDTSQKVTRESK